MGITRHLATGLDSWIHDNHGSGTAVATRDGDGDGTASGGEPGTATGETPAAPEAAPAAEGVMRHPHAGMAVLLAVLFLTFLDNTVISATLADIQSGLHAGVAQLQWVVSGYALTFASLMLMAGSLGDRFGRKKVMLVGVLVFCGGSVVAALATSTGALIAGRVIMGVGAAGSEPGTLSMVRHLYPERKRRARALGWWAAVSGLALAAGPVLGGVLVGIWSWRAVFWFNLLFGALALLAALVVLPENADPTRGRVDIGGFVLGAVALGSATYATIAGETYGYITWWVLSMYALSLVTFVAFVLVELRVTNPMLDMRFFRRPPFAGSVFVAFTTYFGIFSIFFFVALYLEVVGSSSPYQLALDFIPLTAGMVLASLFTGRWVAAMGSRVPMTAGCLIAATGLILTDVVITPTSGLSTVGWTMAIAGIGFGIAIVPVTSTALTSVPGEHSGMAASATNTSRELGGVAGVAILGSIVNGQLTVQLSERLAAIGIPAAYRSQVIAAVTTGSAGSQAASVEGHASASIQQIINKVVSAAYGAFSHGLDLALSASGALLIVSAVVAFATGMSRLRARRADADAEEGDGPTPEPA